MKIKLIAVGKLKERFWREAEGEYVKRLKRYARIEIIELMEEPLPARIDPVTRKIVLQREKEKIYKHMPKEAFITVLDVAGKLFDSQAAAVMWVENLNKGITQFCFIIGGPLGIDEEIVTAAHLQLSLSPLTFTHQLARIILLEQIYRWIKIWKNEPYHY